MKTQLCLFALIIALTVTGIAKAVISNSNHDFSADGWSGGQICVPCHTPHNASANVNAPLWNHQSTVASYTVYDGTTMNADVALDGPSLMCMSCHDGTVAIDSFGGTTGSTTISGGKLLDTNLQDDHPIGATGDYDQALVDHAGKFVAKATVESANVPLKPLGGSDVVSCASCHDVHNNAGNSKLLRVSINASALCLTCHNI